MLVNTRELMEFYELRSTVSLQANLSPRLPTGKIPFLIFFVPQKLKNMLSLSLCYIVRYVIMDFNKFQQWCQNRGFIIKLPSGYVKLINLDVSSFESFKGIFNLCMLFFYEELYKQRENEKEEVLNNCIKNFKNSPTILYPSEDYSSPYICYKNDGESFVEKIRDAGVNKNKSSWNFENGSTITPLNDSESTVRSNRSIKIKKYRKDIDVKYSDEDFEKTFNYLLTPNEDSGIVPMDKLLNYLENKNSEDSTAP